MVHVRIKILLATAIILQLTFLPINLVWAASLDSKASASNYQTAANAASTAGGAIALNLSSKKVSVQILQSMLKQVTAETIQVGGLKEIVTAGEMLTPAEFVAALQVASGQMQRLILDSAGQAVGGSFSLRSLPDMQLSQLTIPSHVVAVVTASSGPLDISGTLDAQGTLLGLSGRNSSSSGITISAGDIDVLPGGKITTVLSPGVAGLSLAAVNLSLSSASSIVNGGSITASGLLSLESTGQIVNALPSGSAPALPAPVIAGNLGTSLFSASGSITNAGTVSSFSGNVLLATGATTNLVINNVSGQITATNGSINFRDATFAANNLTQISGGQLSAQSINFFGGDGSVNANVASMAGTVNVTGGTANILVGDNNLTLGQLNLSGDPNIANSNGDVYLTSNLQFSGEDLTILASGSITASAGVTSIDLSNDNPNINNGNAGSLTLIAGNSFTSSTSSPAANSTPAPDSSTYRIGTPSLSGGDIDLQNVTITTAVTAGSGNGGRVNAVANRGSVNLGAIDTSSASGNGGAVELVGQKGVEVSGAIQTDGASAGNVTLASGNAYIRGLVFNNGSCKCDFAKVSIDTSVGEGDVGAMAISAVSQSGTAGRVSITSFTGTFLYGDVSASADVQVNSLSGSINVLGDVSGSSLGFTSQTGGFYNSGHTLSGTNGIKIATYGSIQLDSGSKLQAADGDIHLASLSDAPFLDEGNVTYSAGIRILIFDPGALSISDHSQFNAGEGLFFIADSVSVGNDVTLQAATKPGEYDAAVYIYAAGTGGITIGTGDTIEAGTFTTDGRNLASAGSIFLLTTARAGAPITINSGLTANGGDIWITSNAASGTGPELNLGNDLAYQANGGGIQIMWPGDITGTNDQFGISAVGSYASSGIAIGAGIGLASKANIQQPFGYGITADFKSLRSNPAIYPVDPASLGQNVSVTTGQPNSVLALSNKTTPGNITLDNSTVNLSSGVLVLGAQSKTLDLTGSQFTLDGGSVITRSEYNQLVANTAVPLCCPAYPTTVGALTGYVTDLADFLNGTLNQFDSAVGALIGDLGLRGAAQLYNSLTAAANSTISGSTIIATDSTPVGLSNTSSFGASDNSGESNDSSSYQPVVLNAVQVQGDVMRITQWQSNLMLFTTVNQVLCGSFGGSKDAVLTGSAGTACTCRRDVVVLHTGHLVVDSGSAPMTVVAAGQTITIPAQTAAAIDVHHGQPTRIMAVGSEGNESIAVEDKQAKVQTGSVAPGEELILATHDLSDDDLIPADGIDRTIISGGVAVQGHRVAKTHVAIDQFFKREIAPSASSVRLSGSNRMSHKRMIAHVANLAKMQNPGFRYVEIPASNNAPHNANEPLRILAAEGTEFSTPVPGVIKLIAGAMFISTTDDTSIKTAVGTVHTTPGALTAVEVGPGVVRVKSMSGPGDTWVFAADHRLDLRPGQEIAVCDHQPVMADVSPADGVGRRDKTDMKLAGNLYAIFSDFSIITLVKSATYLKDLRQENSPAFATALNRIMKTAAAVEVVGAYRGQYSMQKPPATSNVSHLPVRDYIAAQ